MSTIPRASQLQVNSRETHGDGHTSTADLVGLQRRLYALDPDTYRSPLAKSLHTLGVKFVVSKQWGDARSAATEAVGLYRQLFAQDSDTYRANLALSLRNLGFYFSEFELWEDARVAAAEAVTLCWQLFALDPDTYRANLANSLHSLGVYFSWLKLWEDARAAMVEAVTLRRQLFTLDPDTYHPDLALSLYELGVYFNGLKLWEDARAAAAEAVTLRRQLFALDPDTYHPDLAFSLRSLGSYLGQLKLWEDACVATGDAVGLQRTLFAQNPELHRDELASSIDKLAALLTELSLGQDARTLKTYSAELKGTFSASALVAYHIGLADCLQNLKSYQSQFAAPDSNSSRWSRGRRTIRTSIAAIIPEFDRSVLTMPIAEFCEYVENEPITAQAEIVSLARRRDRGSVRHEFLLVHAHIYGALDIWIRLERDARRTILGVPIPSPKFFSRANFLVNDTAIVAHSKKRIGMHSTTRLTSRVKFSGPDPPVLLNLTNLLRMVAEESPQYETLGENCWFFASVVQDLLTEAYGGILDGLLQHANRGAPTRARIRARLQAAIAERSDPSDI